MGVSCYPPRSLATPGHGGLVAAAVEVLRRRGESNPTSKWQKLHHGWKLGGSSHVSYIYIYIYLHLVDFLWFSCRELYASPMDCLG